MKNGSFYEDDFSFIIIVISDRIPEDWEGEVGICLCLFNINQYLLHGKYWGNHWRFGHGQDTHGPGLSYKSWIQWQQREPQTEDGKT